MLREPADQLYSSYVRWLDKKGARSTALKLREDDVSPRCLIRKESLAF